MKQLLSMVVIAGTLTIITFSSCAKEEPWSASAYISPSSYSPPTIPTPVNIELVADNWVNYGPEIYVNTFKGVIASANASGNRTVTVYLQENGKQTQISQKTMTIAMPRKFRIQFKLTLCLKLKLSQEYSTNL